MHEDQILIVSATLSHSYGRCGPSVLYSFTGTAAPSVNDSLGLHGLATYGENSSKALSAKAVAPCPSNNIPDKTCVGVDSIYVAYHQNVVGNCEEDKNKLDFKNGRTVLEFACGDYKSLDNLRASYYINCSCPDPAGQCSDRPTTTTGQYNASFEVIVEGDAIYNRTIKTENGESRFEGHNGWNFYPGLPAIPEDSLYRYPVPVLVKTKGDLKCGVW
jgi:hypothetical protein